MPSFRFNHKPLIIQTRSKTPSVFFRKPQTKPNNADQFKNIRFPAVKFEGEIFKTSLTEPSEEIKEKTRRRNHIIRAIKIVKTLPTVNILNYFDIKTKKKTPDKKHHKKPKSGRNLSLDSTNFKKYPKLNIQDNFSNIFQHFSLSPKKVITNLQSSQQYVKKNSLTREKMMLNTINYGLLNKSNYINYY